MNFHKRANNVAYGGNFMVGLVANVIFVASIVTLVSILR
jgi:hypothetical protein